MVRYVLVLATVFLFSLTSLHAQVLIPALSISKNIEASIGAKIEWYKLGRCHGYVHYNGNRYNCGFLYGLEKDVIKNDNIFFGGQIENCHDNVVGVTLQNKLMLKLFSTNKMIANMETVVFAPTVLPTLSLQLGLKSRLSLNRIDGKSSNEAIIGFLASIKLKRFQFIGVISKYPEIGIGLQM